MDHLLVVCDSNSWETFLSFDILDFCLHIDLLDHRDGVDNVVGGAGIHPLDDSRPYHGHPDNRLLADSRDVREGRILDHDYHILCSLHDFLKIPYNLLENGFYILDSLLREVQVVGLCFVFLAGRMELVLQICFRTRVQQLQLYRIR